MEISRDTSELMVLDRGVCRTNSLLGVLDSIRLFDMTAPMQEGKHTFRMARSGSRFAGCVIESLKNKIVRFCWTSNCVSGGLLVWAPQKDRISPFARLAFPHARIHHVGRWNRNVRRQCYNDYINS